MEEGIFGYGVVVVGFCCYGGSVLGMGVWEEEEEGGGVGGGRRGKEEGGGKSRRLELRGRLGAGKYEPNDFTKDIIFKRKDSYVFQSPI